MPGRLARRLGTAAAVAALAGAGLTGCGGSGGAPGPGASAPANPLAAVRLAAQKSSALTSYHVTGTISTQLTGASTGSFSATLAGDIQLKPLAGQLNVSGLDLGGQTVATLTELITPEAFYLKIPQLAAQTGKPWVKVAYSAIGAASGLNVKQLFSQVRQLQPAQYLQQLLAAGDIHRVGSATVDGVATTHYAGYVPLADEISRYAPSLRTQMRSLLAAAGFKGANVDVWVDGSGYPRRVVSAATGGRGSFRVQMDLSRFGEAVHVTPPPAGQTTDLSGLLGGG